jgi:hypothetical protein
VRTLKDICTEMVIELGLDPSKLNPRCVTLVYPNGFLAYADQDLPDEYADTVPEMLIIQHPDSPEPIACLFKQVEQVTLQ